MRPDTAQDRHLDVLLSMALEQLDQEENEQWILSADPQVEASDALRLDQAFSAAYRVSDQGKKREARLNRKRRAFRALRLAAAALAGMILLALVAFPVALAASEDFRNSFMKLFLKVDQQTSTMTFQFYSDKEGDESLPPPLVDPTPEHWPGTHFPAYVPEGYQLSARDDASLQATFSSPDGGQFTFSENSGSMPEVNIPEGSFFILESIGGIDSPVVEETLPGGGTRITITWEDPDHWYQLIAENMDRHEAISIANSTDIYWINDVMNSASVPNDSILMEEGAPDWWQGSYFPMDLPPNMILSSFQVDTSVTLRDDQGRKISFFIRGDAEEAAGALYLPGSETRHIAINGQDATLLVTEDGHCFCIWQMQDALLELNTVSFGAEETIRMAQSVAPCEKDPEKPYGIQLAHDSKGNVLPPAEWRGRFFPAWLPEGLSVCSMDVDHYDLELAQGKNWNMIDIHEYPVITPSLPFLDNVRETRLVDINGCRGLLVVYEEQGNEIPPLSLYWTEAENVWVNLTGTFVPEETLLQIAGSFQSVSDDAPPELNESE